MGIVYQVVKPPNIQGVLKLMSAELLDHKELRTRFFDEVRILGELEHPNIVRVFDYDALPDGTPFYVMDLLHGRTVRDVLATIGRVPPRIAYEITRQLLEALHCAHTHKIPVIHRDIKPENIFLHAPKHGEPVVKLIDFGVSAVADRKHDGAFVGTWSYAAPEQIRGEPPTAATDLYAAALVLYEMLAGRGAFDHHEDWVAVSEAQLEEIPAPVSELAPWVPKSIVELIAAALEKDPKKRPRDAYAFAERLFELEWASDGKDPHDLTMEGPLRSVRRAAPPSARLSAAERAAGPGPLSRVLTTITGATPPRHPESKKLAAASPASDRLGDVPIIGVPPESVQTGPTWRGPFGLGAQTVPNADALLEGLGAPERKPPSKRERERASDPALLASPPVPAATGRDTFSSQQSDPRAPSRRPRPLAVRLALGGALLSLAALGAVVLVASRRPASIASPARAPTVDSSAPPELAPPPSPSPSIAPAAATSASVPATATATGTATEAAAVASHAPVPARSAPRAAPRPSARPAAPESTARGDYFRLP
jgi:serine/threonine-protein kinase